RAGHRAGDAALGVRGGVPRRPAGLGRAGVVLAAQRRLRALRRRDVLRPAHRPAPPGPAGGTAVMTDTATAPPPDGPGEPAEPQRAGKREVWIVYWAFTVFYTALTIGICFLGRATPPPRPDVSQLQAAAWFHKHQLGIQLGFTFLLMIAG